MRVTDVTSILQAIGSIGALIFAALAYFRSRRAHVAATKAYHEANAVNEKIHAVGTGIIKLVEQSDPTEAAELSRALTAAQLAAEKKNGGLA